MQIRVKLFAILRERASTSELSLVLPDGVTVTAAADALVKKLPPLRDHLRSAAYAVNRAYAPATTILHDGDELAVIPPVSGG